jgi:Holliday junction resolvasome RuvABC endonuclease subunit
MAKTQPALKKSLSGVNVVRPILGIDPSLNSTGLCLVSVDGSLLHSCTLKSKFTGPARLADLRDKLQEFLQLNRPSLIGLEGYSFGSKYAREAVAEWGGLVRVLLYELSRPTLVVSPMTLKKFVLPMTGPNGKDRVALETLNRWGVSFKTSDECDAHALARLALARFKVDNALPLPAYCSKRMIDAAKTASFL